MKNSCNWSKEDYFPALIHADKRSHQALEFFVDDLHSEKEATITTFLSHSGAEDFLWGLAKLLGSESPRVAGNAAYIIGTLAESELGCYRILGLSKSPHAESKRILPDLTNMLGFDDSESVMNAAGTMGTLAESHEGREWMLSEPCLNDMLTRVTFLLHAENMWTASNAALVLARLSISENGCLSVLKHDNSQQILSKIVQSLGVDEAGRGMNAAFAIGRLCDMEEGRKRLLQLVESERMISALAKMLCCEDTGASKNACFALSCLATNPEGHTRILNNLHSDDVINTLTNLLNAEDSETGWFAAMTLRTLASQPRGCLRLREHSKVVPSLKVVSLKEDINADLKEEACITLEILKKLEKPSPPNVEVVGSNMVRCLWDPISTKSGFPVRYQIFDGTKCVYTGKETHCDVTGLHPCAQYSYKLRAYTEGDESPFSDPVSIVTEEAVPTAPQNIRIVGYTISQLKIGWDPPDQINGTIKGYHVYLGEKVHEHTTELQCIISGLQPSTSYEISISASTSKGKGEKAHITGTTSDLGAHAPSKPHVQVIGRNELHISWEPPEQPLGKINRYDLSMNNKVVYSGTDHAFTARRLTPDTEYNVVVTCLTNEGKFESKPTKKRTAKDEYDPDRPPLYQPPSERKDSISADKPQPILTKKKTSLLDKKRVSSAKHPSYKERSRTPGDTSIGNRPTSAKSETSSALQDKQSSEQHENYQRPLRVTFADDHEVLPLRDQIRVITPKKSDSRPSSRKLNGMYSPAFREQKHYQQKQNGQKTDKNSVMKFTVPLSMSRVSMQDDPDKNSEVVHESIKRGLSFVEQSNSNSMKVERSRTFVNSGRYRTRGQKIEAMLGNSTKINPDLIPTAVSVEKFSVHQIQPNASAGTTKDSYKPILNDLPPTKHKHHNNSDIRTCEKHPEKVQSSIERSRNSMERHHSTLDTIRTSTDRVHSSSTRHQDKMRNSQEMKPLPKPKPPSQQYLKESVSNTPLGSRSLPSPRTSKEFAREFDHHDPEWLTRRFLDLPTRIPKNFLSPSGHPSDSSYFLDMQEAFIQRQNTYVNSHRLSPAKSNKSSDYDRGSRESSVTRLPSITQRNKRPINKKSMERLGSKSTTSSSIPLVPNATFGLDLPDNKTPQAEWNSKFIPMQLRTQPANLGMNQLQRMNTIIADHRGGVQFKRVEALARSHTTLDMKPPGTPTLADQLEQFPIKSAKETSRSAAGHKSKRTQNKLVNTSVQRGEPDSILLQQSWAVNTSLASAR
ncbi:uncharacterized protein LOC127728036 isoform X3 [Mytilus californianus]|uniref:uncharacterized protein LOC127728036 isoform X3 n=1 Tax=Mytilus californianus TaxID=6549 RepID=UPI00224792CA|nr:uncharacterized protein LOC127728036 isoform X3 [Mytilus californianus]